MKYNIIIILWTLLIVVLTTANSVKINTQKATIAVLQERIAVLKAQEEEECAGIVEAEMKGN